MSKELTVANEEIGVQQVWDDLVGSLIANKLESVVGKLNYNYAENTITMQSGGVPTNTSDRLIFNFEYPHACVVDGLMKLHIHWEQVNTNKIEFNVQYRVQKGEGELKTTAWITVLSNSDDDSLYTYVSGTLNQKTNIAVVDMTGSNLSATVQFRVTRVDATVGDIEAAFVDAHVLRDMVGSREEDIK